MGMIINIDEALKLRSDYNILKEPLHAKLYLAYRPSDFSSKIIGIMGSSNLTYSGFKGQGELNADFTDSDHVQKLANWFDDRWNDRYPRTN